MALGSALFALLAYHSWTDVWVGDYWLHVATVAEVAASPLHPRNPVFGNEYPFSLLSPYLWALGLAARFSGRAPAEILFAQGLVNLLLLLAALYAFTATWARRSAAPYSLLLVLFLWGRDP